MKLIYPFTLALIAVLAATGCKHTPIKTTQLPSQSPPTAFNPGDTNPQQLPPAQPINPTSEPVNNVTPPNFQNPNSIATSTNWEPGNMIEDRAALAAYTVHFKFDSSAVESKEAANLDAVSKALAADANIKLMIEGHCDERGTEEYNRSLGERRALSLREALSKLGVDAQRVRTISYGKDKPVEDGKTEEAYAKNRRGEFVVYHPKPGA